MTIEIGIFDRNTSKDDDHPGKDRNWFQYMEAFVSGFGPDI
jgi:hypothetical protein